MNFNNLIPYNFWYGRKLITHYAEILETKWENEKLTMVKVKSFGSKGQFRKGEFHDKMSWKGNQIPIEIRKYN